MASTGYIVLGKDGNGRPGVDPVQELKIVAKEFRVSQRAIKSPRKHGRQVCAARDELCRRLYLAGWTQTEIGKFLCMRAPTTISSALQRAEARLKHPEPVPAILH